MRGTDEHRVGPVRLVAGKLATVRQVKIAALCAFGVAGIAGLILAARVTWWFLPLGLLCGIAGWAYTGGPRPYGYLGLGEVSSSCSSGWWPPPARPMSSTRRSRSPSAAISSSIPTTGPTRSGPGSPSASWPPRSSRPTTCATGDRYRIRQEDTGGPPRTARRGPALPGNAHGRGVGIGIVAHFQIWALIALAAIPLAIAPVRLALSDKKGRELLPMLGDTARLQIVGGCCSPLVFSCDDVSTGVDGAQPVANQSRRLRGLSQVDGVASTGDQRGHAVRGAASQAQGMPGETNVIRARHGEDGGASDSSRSHEGTWVPVPRDAGSRRGPRRCCANVRCCRPRPSRSVG